MTSKRLTDANYADMAEDYAARPPTVEEILSLEVNPAFLRMGRPAKGVAAKGKTPVISVRLPDAIRAELVRRAEDEGSSPSELIRQAVVEFLGNHPVTSPR
jgi:Ribbon-helix-helix protein, copG family